MTIAAGILCPDGIVICTDSQETIGTFKAPRQKLAELPLVSSDVKAVVVGSTNNAVFLDELIEKLSAQIDLVNGHLASVRQVIERTVRKYHKDMVHQFGSLADTPIAHILIGLKTIDGLALLEVYAPNIKTIPDFTFIGSGSDLALYKAKHFFSARMPVDVAANVASFILEVVIDNNIDCDRPVQMALIRSDGTVDHKLPEFSQRAGSALRVWDNLANRLGAMLPLLSVGETPVLDMLLKDKTGALLSDQKFERLLFEMIESESGGKLIGLPDWAAQLAAIERGALNLLDANTADLLLNAKNTIVRWIEKVRSDDAQRSIWKEPLNDLINLHNETLAAYLKWRNIKLSRSPNDAERKSLNNLVNSLSTRLGIFSDGTQLELKNNMQPVSPIEQINVDNLQISEHNKAAADMLIAAYKNKFMVVEYFDIVTGLQVKLIRDHMELSPLLKDEETVKNNLPNIQKLTEKISSGVMTIIESSIDGINDPGIQAAFAAENQAIGMLARSINSLIEVWQRH